MITIAISAKKMRSSIIVITLKKEHTPVKKTKQARDSLFSFKECALARIAVADAMSRILLAWRVRRMKAARRCCTHHLAGNLLSSA